MMRRPISSLPLVEKEAPQSPLCCCPNLLFVAAPKEKERRKGASKGWTPQHSTRQDPISPLLLDIFSNLFLTNFYILKKNFSTGYTAKN